MAKKIIILLIFTSISLLLFSNQFNLRTNVLDPESLVNHVKVRVTLPNFKEFTAVLDEGGALEITYGDEYYVFQPRIIDAARRNALIENTYASASAKNLDAFHFEILDVISFPLDKAQLRHDCQSCCVSCDGAVACACAVTMSCGDCCCRPCCNPQY